MKIKHGVGDRLFTVCNTVIMLFLIVVTLYPFWFVVAASFSSAAQVSESMGLLVWPESIHLEAYEAVLANPNIRSGYINTLFYVLVGTGLNLLFTVVLAYGLSRKNVRGTSLFMKLITFTMFFSGGMLPTYILVQKLNLIGTVWSVILPGLISTYNFIILRTSFKAIPAGLEEAAKVEGAGEFTIMTKIVIPLSLPTIMIMVLYYGVAHWNSWFNASLYLTERSMYPLQLVLREILVVNTLDSMSVGASAQDKVSAEQTIKYATIVVATLPILCVYPFLQKYFVKGMMIGAIKE